jgi:phospholipid N-methyltransferase
MRFAVIENNRVANIIEADIEFATQIGAMYMSDLPICIGTEFRDDSFGIRTPVFDDSGEIVDVVLVHVPVPDIPVE